MKREKGEAVQAGGVAEKYGLNSVETEELRRYLAEPFHRSAVPDTGTGFLAPWREWINMIPLMGAAEILNRYVVPKRPVQFEDPEHIHLEIYPSAAGEIPIITLGDDRDFEKFVTNLVYKGERPDGISRMGASFIYGEKQRFIVLSEKPYSNVPAQWMGLEEGVWREKSMILRREHECTHYYTRRHYGGAQNHLHDELMADFFGLHAAFDRYEARWFKHFMGVDRSGEGTPSGEGRLPLYTAGLSQNVMRAVEEVTRTCADALETWSTSAAFKGLTKQEKIERLWDLNFQLFSGLVDLGPGPRLK